MGFYIQKVLQGSCSVTSLLWHFSVLGKTEIGQERDRFWAERLIFSSTEELSFRGTRFWWQDTHTEGMLKLVVSKVTINIIKVQFFLNFGNTKFQRNASRVPTRDKGTTDHVT